MASENSLLKIETHTAPILEVRQRLQDYAVGIFYSITSRKGTKNAIKKGLVFINSEKGYTGDWICGGETLELFQNTKSKKPAVSFKLEVLFEDEYLAIINKPAGVLVSGNKRFTIENALSFNLKKSLQPDALLRPEPIHRLDYPTTGALLIGKTASIVTALNKLFEARCISKTYHAVVTGSIEHFGVIKTDIDEKPSKSEFKKIASVPSLNYEFLNLMVLTPHTGRRHQLRKHLAGIGNPIFGDSQYKKEGVFVKGKGLYLHASSLKFKHPINKETLLITAPLPKKFTKLFPTR